MNYLIFIFILLVFTVLVLYLTKDIDEKYRKIINTVVYICVTVLCTTAYLMMKGMLK